MANENADQSLGAIIKGLLVLAAIVVIIACAMTAVLNFAGSSLTIAFNSFSSMDAAIVVALITGCVSILTVVSGAILNNYLSYRQRRNEYLRSHREDAYEKLIDVVYKMMSKSKKGEEYSENEILDDMNEFNKGLTLWGSSKAIRLWDSWRLSSVGKKPKPEDLLLAMERVLIQLRVDMGQGRGVRPGDLLKLFINDVDEKILNK